MLYFPVFGLFSKGYKYVTITLHMQKVLYEVIIIRRILSLTISFMALVVVLGLPRKAQAATDNAKAGIVAVTSGVLNVRSGASTSASRLTTLTKGSYVTLLSRSGSWWQVEYADGMTGYCHADYITPVQSSEKTVQITSGSLNVRSGAGTAYARTDSLYRGEKVLVLSASGGWSRILYDGTKTGYVSSAYLGNSSTYSAVSLSVPNYKQTDSRWANVTLGSSGKTIRQSGCTTTAIAMIESYRSGTTITPDVMARKLRYSSSGDLYWPSDYIVVTSSRNYLSTIYQKLKEGKPILFGVKNSSGRQHWVVITGFAGGALAAANFTVNDPGSNSRTTLQQFLNAYPNFYKYFYYA